MNKKINGGRGGDVTFRPLNRIPVPGKGAKGINGGTNGRSGEVKFLNAGGDVLIEINNKGFFFKGKKVTDKNNVYARFKYWLDQAIAETPLRVMESKK